MHETTETDELITITFKISKSSLVELANDVFANYPEYAAGSAFVCRGWDYDAFEFVFQECCQY